MSIALPDTYTVKRKWERIVSRGSEKSQPPLDTVSRTPPNTITYLASTVVAGLTGPAVLEDIKEGMRRFLAAGLSIIDLNSTPSSHPHCRFSFASFGAMECATLGGMKLTAIWRANDAGMADSCKREGESFFSIDACYCHQCDNAVFAVLKLIGCVVFSWQGVGR